MPYREFEERKPKRFIEPLSMIQNLNICKDWSIYLVLRKGGIELIWIYIVVYEKKNVRLLKIKERNGGRKL